MAENMKLAGVIGDPISHSKSPALHGHWIKRYGIHGVYVPLPVKAESLEDVVRAMPKMGFKGANVTIPHKEQIFEIADVVTQSAKAIGAANTLIFKEEQVIADNTDGIGFMANLYQSAPQWKPQNTSAVVLGAGGAAKAIIWALLDAGASEIILTNRTRARAETLAKQFGPKIKVVDWGDVDNHLPDAGLLVNTTSLGMNGQPPLSVSLEHLQAQTLVTDIVYAPLETDLLKSAKAQGCQTVDGLGMLLHQAAKGFEAWFGVAPEVDEDLRASVLSA